MSFSLALQQYTARYGRPQTPSYSQWEPPETCTNKSDVISSFFRASSFISLQSWQCFQILSLLNSELLSDHVLPQLRLIETDMLGYVINFVPYIQVSFLTGFVQSFATLIRAHKVRYVQCAWGVTDGQLLLSWMADIFFAPMSLINSEAIRVEADGANGANGGVNSNSVANAPATNSPITRSRALVAGDAGVKKRVAKPPKATKRRKVRATTDDVQIIEVVDLTGGDPEGDQSGGNANSTDPTEASAIATEAITEVAPDNDAAPIEATPTDTPSTALPAILAPPYTPIPDIMAKVEELAMASPPESVTTAPARRTPNNINDVISNLNVRYPRLTTSWPEDMLPKELSFSTLEAAIHYAMNHAFPRHYQLLQRYKSGTVFLYCNRMSPDEMDAKWNKSNGAAKVRDHCNFALRVDHDKEKDTWHLKHVEDCSEHNHGPNVDPSVFSENKMFINGDDPGFSDEFEPSETDLQLLLDAPFIYSQTNGSHTFFAHIQGYRFWRTYPEVILFEDVFCRTINEQHYRIVMIRGVDCHDQAIPIAATVVHVTEGVDDDIAVYKWILIQLKTILDKYNISPPGFIQVRCGSLITVFEACQKSFPDSYVFMDPEAAEELAHQTVNKYVKRWSSAGSFLFQWEELLAQKSPHEIEYLSDKMYECASRGGRQFLQAMERKVENISKIYKLRQPHFDVDDCKKYHRNWGVNEKPNSVFELVHCLLRQFVLIYEIQSQYNAMELVTTPSEPSNKFYNATRLISKRVRLEVQKFWREFKKNKLHPPARCTCRKTPTRGYGCRRCLYKIKRTRKHSPSDFHPHWRNLYADLSHVMVDEKRRYADKWAKVEELRRSESDLWWP